MYASTAHCLFVRHVSLARARMLARRTSSTLLVIARISLFHVCVYDARYVRCRRVPLARAMSASYSCSQACLPFMNARSPVARFSMGFHLCLYVVKSLHASYGPTMDIYCSFSFTDVHVCSTLVGIMCMLPSCSAGLCPLRVADHPRTPHLCSSASVVVAFLLVRQMW